MISIYGGGLDSDCTVVTIQRVANFRVKHTNSDPEGYNTLGTTIYTTKKFSDPEGYKSLGTTIYTTSINILYRFPVKKTLNRRPVFRVKKVII